LRASGLLVARKSFQLGIMANAKSAASAERMRRSRARRAAGTIMVPHIQITRPGVEALIARGLLDNAAANDPAQVRAALVQMINKALSERPEPPRHAQLGRHVKALRSIAFGLF
jgi:hypothetical protein